MRVNGEIGKGVTVALERGQTMPARRRRKSHCSTWDKHNFILMNNWESLELGWDKCAWVLRVSVSWQCLDCFQLRSRIELGLFRNHMGSQQDMFMEILNNAFLNLNSKFSIFTSTPHQLMVYITMKTNPVNNTWDIFYYLTWVWSPNMWDQILPQIYLRLISVSSLCCAC